MSDVFLEIRYVGDVGRLYAGDRLLDDDFFKGTPWRVGLKRFAAELARGPLELRVLPLRADAPIYVNARQPRMVPDGQRAELNDVTAEPEYELIVGML